MNYQKHYNTLIDRSRARITSGYTERHHILPRCMGGEDTVENIVNLTPEEHFVAHQLLVKMYPMVGKLALAALIMTTDKFGRRVNNKLFGWLRKRMGTAISEINKANAATRCKKSGDTQRGKTLAASHRAKISVAGLNRKHSQETKAKQSAAAINRSAEEKHRRLEAKKNPQYREKLRQKSANKLWMFNPATGKSSFTNKNEVLAKLDIGWVRGRRAP